MSAVIEQFTNADTSSVISGPDGGLKVVVEQGEENIIEIKGDGEVGVTGGSLKDEITTGAGDAVIFGGGGNDIITTGNGNDVVRGGDGDDMLVSGNGADVLLGGAGNDILRSGKAAMDGDGNAMAILDETGQIVDNDPESAYGDVLKGGTGDDIFQFNAAEFEDGVVDKIVDFKDDNFADTIKIFNVGVDGNVTYDNETGIVSVNGNKAIDIGAGKEVDFKSDEDSDTWDLF